MFHEAGRLGFDGLEFDVQREYTEDTLWSEEGRSRLRRLAAETGVEVASVCLGALWGQTFASDDAGERARAADIVMSACRFTPELGARVILVPMVGVEDQEPTEGRRRWIEALQPCAQLAEQTGAVLALENVGYHSAAKSAPDLAAVVEGVGSPAVRAYYDVGNGKTLGFDPLEELRYLGDRIVQVHVKGPGSVQLYENRLDITAVAQTLRAIDYDGYLVFETRSTTTPSQAARRNLDILRSEIEAAYG